MQNYINPIARQNMIQSRNIDAHRSRVSGIKPQPVSAREQRVLDEFDKNLVDSMINLWRQPY